MQHILYLFGFLTLVAPLVHAGPTAVVPDFPKAGYTTTVEYDPKIALFEEVAVRSPADAAVDAQLFAAVAAGNVEGIEAALLAGASVHAQQGELGVTPLHNAPSVAVAEALLDVGASVYARNTYDMTPLHNQVIRGRIDIARLLLDAGALASARDYRGWTALDWVEDPPWGVSPASEEMVMLLTAAMEEEETE